MRQTKSNCVLNGWSNLNGVYNIRVGFPEDHHVGRDFLSTTPDGAVDLWKEDDLTGRQQWKLTQIGGVRSNLYNVEIAGGTNDGE